MTDRTTKVGIIGLGTVGGSVAARLINREKSLNERTGEDVRLSAAADLKIPDSIEKLLKSNDVAIYTDAKEMINESDCDIIVELIGGMEPAETFIMEALSSGMDVVTANKELLAKSGKNIFKHAYETQNRIYFEASVGGSIPVIRTLREGFVDSDCQAIYGIINGTANYILSHIESDGEDFDRALSLAQEKGYAEADPTYDVEGNDSAHKIAILAAMGFGTRVTLDEIYCEGITRIGPEIVEDARQLGFNIKLLGIAKKTNGKLDVRVHPTMIPTDSALAAVREEYNAVFVQADPLGSAMFYGKGAGGAPTATAVIADIFSLASTRGNDRPQAPVYFGQGLDILPMDEVETRYYLRLMALDRPGVLAHVTRILGEHGISIDSVIQHGRSEVEEVPVILTTHEAREGKMRSAVKQISKLEEIGEKPVWIRIEEEIGSEDNSGEL